MFVIMIFPLDASSQGEYDPSKSVEIESEARNIVVIHVRMEQILRLRLFLSRRGRVERYICQVDSRVISHRTNDDLLRSLL